jgi:plastocyanin
MSRDSNQMAESRRQDSWNRLTSRAVGAGARLLFLVLALCNAGCGGSGDVEPQPPIVLARIDSLEVTDVDFDESMNQWEADPAAATTAQWRQRLRLLIDRQLLILEARELGFYDDPRVLREVELWERSRIMAELLETEADSTTEGFTEEELHEFYYATGANRELLVGRLVLQDDARAAAALRDVQAQMPFAGVVETYAAAGQQVFADSLWLNGLSVTDDQLRSLMSRFVGDVEMFSLSGRYLVAVVLDERSAALEERRPLAEEAFKRDRQKEVNLTYLASLMQKYDVFVDSVGIDRLASGVGGSSPDLSVRLVHSSLGDWTAAQYRGAIARLPPEQRPASRALRDLKLHILRTYAVDQLLPREVEAKGLGPDLARRRQTMREQKAIEALWAAKGLARVAVTERELRRYFAANRDRYAPDMTGATAAASVRAKVLQDLKEQRAAPLFDKYVAELRSRYLPRVSIDAPLFRAYVARKAGASPIPPALNGCDPLAAIDATASKDMEIHFGSAAGYAYQPGCIAVSTGTIVTFVGDFGAHPLVPGRIDGGEVISDDASPLRATTSGGEARFLMTQPGAHGYFCDKHVAEAMVGAIFVE